MSIYDTKISIMKHILEIITAPKISNGSEKYIIQSFVSKTDNEAHYVHIREVAPNDLFITIKILERKIIIRKNQTIKVYSFDEFRQLVHDMCNNDISYIILTYGRDYFQLFYTKTEDEQELLYNDLNSFLDTSLRYRDSSDD